MKIEDLMIGDWYYWEAEGKKYPMQVAKDTFKLSEEDISNFQPIPLTDEILEKHGFENVNNKTRLSLERDNFYFGYYSTHHMTVYNKNTGTLVHKIIHYVHEVQHAIVFCEIDKEIKL